MNKYFFYFYYKKHIFIKNIIIKIEIKQYRYNNIIINS